MLAYRMFPLFWGGGRDKGDATNIHLPPVILLKPRVWDLPVSNCNRCK